MANVISTVPAGYVITVDGGQLDVDIFEHGVRVARQQLEARRLGEAAQSLSTALSLWRGPALHGLDTPRMLAVAERFNESRLAARELRIDIELRRGRHDDVLGELLDLVAGHPWREHAAAQLMLALYRSGRRRDALAAFEQTQRLLRTELGIDPSPDLTRLRDRMLRDDPLLLLIDEPEPVPASADTATDDEKNEDPTDPVAMLPRAVPHLVGRDDDLRTLDDLAVSDAGTAVATIVGPPGVGKTALAVHWGHRVAGRFPDGQLFVDLHGHGPGTPSTPMAALTTILVELGVPVAHLPADETVAVARYRSLLAGKRMLVVLDNARDAGQVRPLLPAGPGSVAVVTSRQRMTGLTAVDGARPMTLGLLTESAATQLLEELLGSARLAAEPAAARALIALCGRLPLALRIAAAQLQEETGRSIGEHVTEVGLVGRLTAWEVTGDDVAAVRPVLARSYAGLDDSAARLFRLLGPAPGSDASVAYAAVLLDTDPATAATLLESLVAAHLVERRRADRFGLHDLLREFAVDRCAAEESEPGRTDALRRLFLHLADRADAASALAFPGALGRKAVPAELAFRDRSAALAWLDVELSALVDTATMAAHRGSPDIAPRLMEAMRGYLWLRHDYDNWSRIAQAVLAGATDTGDARAQAGALLSLGMAKLNVRRYGEAIVYLRQSQRISRSITWRECEAAALGNLGSAHSELGEITQAVEAYRNAFVINDDLGRSFGRANNLGNLGLLQLRLGQFHAAAEHLEQGAATMHELDSRHSHAIFIHGLGQAERHLGRMDVALAHLVGALEMMRRDEDVEMQIQILSDLAGLHVDLGEWLAARDYADEAIRLARAVANPELCAYAGHARARALAGRGDHRAAMAEAEEAVVRAVESDSNYLLCLTLTGRAAVGLQGGSATPCLAWAWQAVDTAHGGGFRDLEGEALTILAEAELLAGDFADARAHAQTAAEIHRETGHRRAEIAAQGVAEDARARD